MKELTDRLSGGERLDLGRILSSRGSELPELLPLREIAVGDVRLSDLTQRTLDALREDPPPPPVDAPPGPCLPWWTSMPSASAAALLAHIGLCTLRTPLTRRGDFPPHARESAKAARELLRRLDLPFEIREHAVALILHYARPEGLVLAAAPAGTWMRLACRMDLRALYHIRLAECRALPRERAHRAADVLDAFRARAEELNVFGRPPAPPVTADEVRTAGVPTPRAAHRIVNTLRALWLREQLAEDDWPKGRLAEEARVPAVRFNLLVGPAGSGKSTWATQHLGDSSVVSSDATRAELTGDPADQSKNDLVFRRCMDRLRALLREGKTPTLDATNYMEGLRDAPVRCARRSGAEIHSFLFDTPLATTLRRNAGRARKVPESVIQRHYRLLTPPALYEADQHWVVDEAGRARLYWPVAPAEARAE